MKIRLHRMDVIWAAIAFAGVLGMAAYYFAH